jgi:hypothetical protein
MKILLDIFNLKTNHPKHFYLFANRKDCSNIDKVLKNCSDYASENSISIFFNTAEPLKFSKIARESKHKWIFFRLLAMDKKYGYFFRDLDLLKNYCFDRYFFIPDLLDPKYKKKNFLVPTIDYLLANNIDITKLNHFSLFDSKEFITVKKCYPNNNENVTMSSGLWIYLYLKYKYPGSIFTLLDYTFNISTKYHSPEFEKGFFMSEIVANRCELIDSNNISD